MEAELASVASGDWTAGALTGVVAGAAVVTGELHVDRFLAAGAGRVPADAGASFGADGLPGVEVDHEPGEVVAGSASGLAELFVMSGPISRSEKSRRDELSRAADMQPEST